MDFFNENDIKLIINQCGVWKVNNLRWTIKDYSDKLVGYLGEHLRLTVCFESENMPREIIFFIKCTPRFDKWKANYLRETTFFNKEYVMLSSLFKNFEDSAGHRKWRPKLLYIKEELFVFEDVTQIGYTMPSNLNTLTYDEIIATVTALAQFHAQSFIYEERKSMELKRPYRIWEDYAEYLCEPKKGQSWRDTGMKAVIDFLKVFSRFKFEPNFTKAIDELIPKLFIAAQEQMKPNPNIRNVVIHRDLWSNNIFFKKEEDGIIRALLIDYQTVLYSAPMLDLSSMIYFNTNKSFRNKYAKRVIEHYYDVLSSELKLKNLDIQSFLDKNDIMKSYEESLVFALTQAALINPITVMTDEKRKQYFENPDIGYKINCVSRSEEFIELARENIVYKKKIIELFDEIVERFSTFTIT